MSSARTAFGAGGKYICAVLQDDELAGFRDASAVIGMVDRIKRVITQPHGGGPKWGGAWISGPNGPIVDPRFVKQMQDWAVWLAKEAGLPLLHRHAPITGASLEAAGAAADEGLNAAEQMAGQTILLPLTLAKLAARVIAPKAVAKVDTFVEVKKRHLQHLLFRASLDYGPLVP